FRSTGKNRGHSGAYRTFANLKFPFAGDQRGMANGDAGNIRDGVQRTRFAVKRNTEIARARLRARVVLRWEQKCCEEACAEQDCRLERQITHCRLCSTGR